MKTMNLIKALRWMRNHKKLVIFVIIVILMAILASCMGGEGSSATLAVGMLVAGVENGNVHTYRPDFTLRREQTRRQHDR